jgi:hypothetical protein
MIVEATTSTLETVVPSYIEQHGDLPTPPLHHINWGNNGHVPMPAFSHSSNHGYTLFCISYSLFWCNHRGIIVVLQPRNNRISRHELTRCRCEICISAPFLD